MSASDLVKLARAQGKLPDRLDSEIEALFAQQLRAAQAPPYVRNYAEAIPGRKLEVDFAWPELRFGIEVQGGAHRIKANFHRDAEKACLAYLAGWVVLPVTGRQIRDARAGDWAIAAIARRREELRANNEVPSA